MRNCRRMSNMQGCFTVAWDDFWIERESLILRAESLKLYWFHWHYRAIHIQAVQGHSQDIPTVNVSFLLLTYWEWMLLACTASLSMDDRSIRIKKENSSVPAAMQLLCPVNGASPHGRGMGWIPTMQLWQVHGTSYTQERKTKHIWVQFRRAQIT